MARSAHSGPNAACPRVGRCEACGTSRQLDGRSWDQDPTPPDHGVTAP
jgi:hypothetical protein